MKGGENVNVAMVRDLAHLVKREKAKFGVFIALADPSKPMLTEAVKEGFYETPFGKFPVLQILTIEQLLKRANSHKCRGLTQTPSRKQQERLRQSKMLSFDRA